MRRVVYDDATVLPNEGTKCTEKEGKTRQSEADSADVNKIMARFAHTGQLPGVDQVGLFADVSEMVDFREAREQVRRVEEFFMGLDAGIRARFDNDPALFLDRFNDGVDRSTFQEIGLEEKPEEPVEEPKPDAGGSKSPKE